MCGQIGLILGRKRRRVEEREYLKDIFTRLLLLSEPRGPHATGLAWVNRDGEHRIFKAPLPAREFIGEPAYQETLDGVGNHTTILMGHTRWPTRGDVQNNFNNHPIRSLDCLGTANGTINNADALFRRFRLRRHAEVDSELIFRLANRLTGEDGQIDVERLIAKLARFRGQMSAVLVSRRDPGTIIVLKGDKPLFLWLNPKRRAIAYASNEDYLFEALEDDLGWRPLDIPPMTLVQFDHESLGNHLARPFHFTVQRRRNIMPEGII